MSVIYWMSVLIGKVTKATDASRIARNQDCNLYAGYERIDPCNKAMEGSRARSPQDHRLNDKLKTMIGMALTDH